MQIKLLKMVKDTKAGSIIDCDEVTATELIEAKEAIIDNSTIDEVQAIVQKEVQIHTKGNKKMENKVQEFALAKLFRGISQKSITGMSEGTAADGGSLVYTGLAEVQDLIMRNSQVYSKCKKLPVVAQANAMKVPYIASSMYLKANAPVYATAAEGVAASTSKLVIGSRTLTLAKTSCPVAVTAELLEDDAALEAYIRGELVGKLAMVLDREVLVASNVGANGYTSVIGDSATFVQTQSLTGTPVLSELQAAVTKVDPTLKPEWFLSSTIWNTFVSTFMTASNIGLTIVDPVGKKLLGLPVNVVPCLGDAQWVLGDFSKYCVIESAQSPRLQTSVEALFVNDEILFRIIHRGAGAALNAVQATAATGSISAFVSNA